MKATKNAAPTTSYGASRSRAASAKTPAPTNGSAASRSIPVTTTVPAAARAPDWPCAVASSMKTAMAVAPVRGTTVFTKIEANRTATRRRDPARTPTARKPCW